ncbi:hypothetical protein Q8A67_013412 [Cirrhinus molitorella]|uniref:Small integral membrane protein 32 n=2 Tax=Labeonini TaxID=2743697 RepID=A0AA88TJ23_9TELE|nr:hypothetical protein Q8A67_013412 [Cirrhinus molitorella]
MLVRQAPVQTMDTCRNGVILRPLSEVCWRSGGFGEFVVCERNDAPSPSRPAVRGAQTSRFIMLRQMLLNSTAAARDFDLMSNTHTPAPLNVSHGPVSVSALLKPTGRGSALREGEPDKPDLATYVVMCLVLFLLVLLIVFFINCQLRNSFFASMPYDRSLREARSSYK